jgi:hypothetical protein
MKLSRRKLMMAGVGASQLALLSRFNLLGGRARAAEPTDRPTKLLTIYIPGGVHHEMMWASILDSALPRLMPPAEQWPGVFYNASMLQNLDRSGNADADAPIRRIRCPVGWNWDNPADRSMGEPNNKGYVWAAPEYRLYENTAIIHGSDQGTAAHGSGFIASMSGVATADFTVPSIPARIANHFLGTFENRVVPSVVVGPSMYAPSVTLPSAVNSATVLTLRDLEYTLSDRRPNWNDLRERTEMPASRFDGMPGEGTLPLTALDAASLQAIRGRRGRSSHGTDVVLEQLYDTYSAVSKTIARDVISILENTPGVENLPAAMPWTPNNPRFGWQLGTADFFFIDANVSNEFDLALRFLKSDLTTSVTFRMNRVINFDTHTGGPYDLHRKHYCGVLETIGRLLAEMKLTPSPSRPDRTLLDETLVVITSEFGRTYPITGGSDHNPIHSTVLVNGLIQGNRMIGGVAENGLGSPVEIIEETGTRTTRPPSARDVAATIMSCFGMTLQEAHLTGGYGFVDGIARP